MKILLAVDGSEYTNLVLRYVAQHVDLLGPEHEYTILTVVPAVPVYAARFLSHEVLESYYYDQAREVLRPIRWFTEQSGWNIQVVHLSGHAADVISNYAESSQQKLIVMGTHGHSALKNVILGSVSAGVIARSKLPILLVR